MLKLLGTTVVLLFWSTAISQDDKIIQADIRGKQCNGGSGFCGTVREASNKNQNTNMKNFTAIKTSSTSIMLELLANSLSKEDQLKFFGKEYAAITTNEKLEFIQEDDYEFSFDMLLYLGLDTRYKFLKKGEYPLQIVDDKVQVLLTLSTT